MHEYTEIYPGDIAVESIKDNIRAGAEITAGIGRAVTKRTFNIDHQTGEVGIGHQILAGRPGTPWYRFYNTLIRNIPQN